MKTALKCDDVFDLLTAGPLDESGSDQASDVNEHLRNCDSCRDLAEAMRPALHILHEALPADQLNGLPVYLSASDRAVRDIMHQVRSAPTTQQEQSRLGTSLLWFAACAASLLIASWIYNGSVSVTNATEPNALASMSLPTTCINEHPADEELDNDQLATASTWFECCTRCHNATSKSLEDQSKLSSVLLACQHCHTGM